MLAPVPRKLPKMKKKITISTTVSTLIIAFIDSVHINLPISLDGGFEVLKNDRNKKKTKQTERNKE